MAIIFSKTLTNTDIWVRLEVPTGALEHFAFPAGENSMALQVIDQTRQEWEFHLKQRAVVHHRRPAMVGEWLDFVRNKGLQIEDKVIFHTPEGNDKYRIEALRKIPNFKLLGQKIEWVLVDQAEGHGVY